MTASGLQATYKLRAGRPTDLEAVLAIQQCNKSAPHWSATVWADVLSEFSTRGVFIVEGLGKPVGFIVLSAAAAAELESIVVMEQHRGRGLGRALCERGLAWAVERNAEEVLLEVRASNGVAIALYHDLGFVEQGRRQHYYSSPREDAVLMALSFRSAEIQHGATL